MKFERESPESENHFESVVIKKLLVANRGEIAVRVLRAASELGIPTVTLFADQDRGALHVSAADESVPLRGHTPGDTYLDAGKIIEAALSSGADAVHPGYGFLAENADFARSCTEAGLCFVGPPSDALRLAGSKLEAREKVEKAGVPVLPIHRGPLASFAREAPRVGFPLLIKAAAGGGGRGIRRVDEGMPIEKLARAASREALSAFADGEVYLERLVKRTRHVEFQILADRGGRIAQLGERDCSVQRRHQKIIEESPSPVLGPDLRRKMADAAVRAARAVGYQNAGTVEFLVELDSGRRPKAFYFLEINARIQVEHPVTEFVTGEDLLAWQLRIARGESLPPDLTDIETRGHAIECRICAEKPPEFLPSTGTLIRLVEPRGPGVRWDGGYVQGERVPAEFDSLLGKVIVHDRDRPRALRRMLAALRSTEILGVDTNQDYLADALTRKGFEAGDYTTDFLVEEMADWKPREAPEEVSWLARKATERHVLHHDDGPCFPGPWEELAGWNPSPERVS